MLDQPYFKPFNLGLLAAVLVPLIGAGKTLMDAQPAVEEAKKTRFDQLDLINHPERLNEPAPEENRRR